MRLSDAGLHQRQTKALYPNHRSSPWSTEDATRDRSNRLLDVAPGARSFLGPFGATKFSGCKIYQLGIGKFSLR
jgi:hypothetical protein